MKLLSNTKTDDFHQIEIEHSFLFWKFRVKYRKVGDEIFIYEDDDKYFRTSTGQFYSIKELFNAKVTTR